MRKLNIKGGFWLTIGQDYRGALLGDNWTPAELYKIFAGSMTLSKEAI